MSALFALIHERLNKPTESFYLRIPPQQKVTVIDAATKTFAEYGLVPGAMLYFCWQSGNKPIAAFNAETVKLIQPFVDEGV